MREFEEALYAKGFKFIVGVDEAGRGPLAGPVVAAAVVLPKDFDGADLGIKDSKKLSPKKREELYQLIIKKSLAYGIGQIGHREIDEINILEATKKAMKEAINQANLMLGDIGTIDHVLIDAVKLEDLGVDQTSLVKGDDRSQTIGAASILAKVYRDRLMINYEKQYPGYGFDRHKGYGTKAHYEAIRELGLCDIHRRSFTKGY